MPTAYDVVNTTAENDDCLAHATTATTTVSAVSSSVKTNNESRDCFLDQQDAAEYFDDDSENNNIVRMNVEEAIDRVGMGFFQYQILFACGLCFMADAMEILLLSFLAVILRGQWGLSEGQVDSLVSVVFAGAMIGTIVLSPLGDRWGRKPVLLITACTISFFGSYTAFCTSYTQVLSARFLVGFGVGGLTVPYDALGEFMPSSYRGPNMLSTSFFWTCGSLSVPLFAWLTLGNSGDVGSNDGSWRAFVTLCALPCIVSTVLGIFLVPESPRWLLANKKHEKALEILRQAAAKNGKDPFMTFPKVTRLVDENTDVVDSSISIESDGNEDTQQRDKIRSDVDERQNDYTNVSHTNNGCWYLCSNPRWRKMSLLVGGQWYGQAFMYYGAIMSVSIVFSNVSSKSVDDAATDDVHDKDGSNGGSFDFDYGAIFITSSAETVGLIIAILMVDRFGRVRTQIWTYVSGGLCILIMGFLDFYDKGDIMDENEPHQQEERRHLIFFSFCSRMFIMAATSVTWLHTAELLPTQIRATGHGLGKY